MKNLKPNDAIKYGNRLIMMHEGQIVVDIEGEKKSKLTTQELLSLFEAGSGGGTLSDKQILSK